MTLLFMSVLGTWIGYWIADSVERKYHLVKHQVDNNRLRRELGMPTKNINWRI